MVHEVGPSHRERLRVEKVHTAAGKRREKKEGKPREAEVVRCGGCRWFVVSVAGG